MAGPTPRRGSSGEVARVFLGLGCSSFGAPIAHLGYFQRELVERRAWLSAEEFAELVALAQALPGPTSSQVGVALGAVRAGWRGAMAAWVCFTAPSAALMLALAFGAPRIESVPGDRLLHGLQLAAVAVVAQAVVMMRKSLAPDVPRMLIAVSAMVVALVAPAVSASPAAILLGAVAGVVGLQGAGPKPETPSALQVSRRQGVVAGAALAALLAAASLPARWLAAPSWAIFTAFFRSGALVFGGGHVVLPLLEQTVVGPGWMTQQRFLAGYGAAQALPGPLFSVAAYLGASVKPGSDRLVHGLIALGAIFLPGFLAMTAVLPFWNSLRRSRRFAAALAGVNAAVVGLLAAALVRPLGVSTLRRPADLLLAGAAFGVLLGLRWPSWLVVLLTALAAMLVANA